MTVRLASVQEADLISSHPLHKLVVGRLRIALVMRNFYINIHSQTETLHQTNNSDGSLRGERGSLGTGEPPSVHLQSPHKTANCNATLTNTVLPSSRLHYCSIICRISPASGAQQVERWTCDQILLELRNNLGQVVHTYVPLSASSITWYQSNGGDALRLRR